MAAPRARGAASGAFTRASIWSSHTSGNFVPSEEKSLMPLSSNGLWEAESTMPPSAASARVSSAIPGVGSTPTTKQSPPAPSTPAVSADSRRGPERRVSRPITSRTRSTPRSVRSVATSCRPTRQARSGVSGSSLATPRMPSVPNQRVTKGSRSPRVSIVERTPAPGRRSSDPRPAHPLGHAHRVQRLGDVVRPDQGGAVEDGDRRRRQRARQALLRAVAPGDRSDERLARDADTEGAPERDEGPERSEEHTSELQSRPHLVCRLLLEKKKNAGATPRGPAAQAQHR